MRLRIRIVKTGDFLADAVQWQTSVITIMNFLITRMTIK